MKINLGCKNDTGMIAPDAGGGTSDTNFPTLRIEVEKGKEKLLSMLAKKGKATITFEPSVLEVVKDGYNPNQAGTVTLKVYSIELPDDGEDKNSDDAIEDFMDVQNMN